MSDNYFGIELGDSMEIDDNRKNRYLDKLDKIEKRCSEIQSWIKSEQEFINDERNKLAVYKAFQESVEAITDICAMFLIDTNRGVGDDYENLKKCSDKLYPKELLSSLREANGLRNRVLHEYNGLEDLNAYKSIKRLNKDLKTFEKEVRKCIKKK